MRHLLVRTWATGIQHALLGQLCEFLQVILVPHRQFPHSLDTAHQRFLPLIALANWAFLRIFGLRLFSPAAIQLAVTLPCPLAFHHLVKLPTVPFLFIRAVALWIQRFLPRLTI
jgi:hypothetical protein